MNKQEEPRKIEFTALAQEQLANMTPEERKEIMDILEWMETATDEELMERSEPVTLEDIEWD